MAVSNEVVFGQNAAQLLSARYDRTRSGTTELCSILDPEDCVVQSMPDASPAKWHLAHVTWFFEHFVLVPHLANYKVFDESFNYLFNSYYYGVGPMHLRPQRGMLSRPSMSVVMAYRQHVDSAMSQLLLQTTGFPEIADLVILGLNHEQQHQELLLTDIKHLFSCNPLKPAVNEHLPKPRISALSSHQFNGGVTDIQEIGAEGDGFHFDNETPRHKIYIHPHQIGSRLITNGEFLEFIRDEAYSDSGLWLSDGWATVKEQRWNRPLYWNEGLDAEFTLGGERDLDLNAPVSHISFYEADAFARWAEARLPTEAEWELAADSQPVKGNFAETEIWQPQSAGPDDHQLFGDVWEWTSSSYAPYPGFRPLEGSLGEYNGKFMCNQMTVRGGSCVSASEHIRSSYRSFFYPDSRWQFLGLRLARNS